jgi:hypothetical protein
VGLWNFMAQGDGSVSVCGDAAAAGSLLVAAANAARQAHTHTHPPSVVIEELPDEATCVGVPDEAATVATAADTGMMEVEPLQPQLPRAPSVPLVRTIAGGVFEQAASAASTHSRRNSGSVGGGGGVFGNPLASAGPVYGLNALTALPNAKPTVPDLELVGGLAATPSRGTSGAGLVSSGGSGGGGGVGTSSSHKRGAGEQGGVAAGVTAAEAAKRRRTASGAGMPPGSAAGAGGGGSNNVSGAVTFDPLSHHRQWCPWIFTGVLCMCGCVGGWVGGCVGVGGLLAHS